MRRRPSPAGRPASLLLALGLLVGSAIHADSSSRSPRTVAVLTTEYRHNSHADVIASRLVLTDRLDGTGKESPLKMVSVYTDQRPQNDISHLLAASHRFRIATNITDALTLGTGALAVDGVLLIAEHGNYPKSPTGNTQYPKRRFWDETLSVFRKSGRVVPVFVDKHLADTWGDAKHLYDTARELGIPLMAGSSVPGSWRRPPRASVPGEPLEEVVILTYGSTDHYGFHALECLQSVVEGRRGGETGVRTVRMTKGDAVWTALGERRVDPDLLAAALERLAEGPLPVSALREKVGKPILWEIEYVDGLRARVLELNGAIQGWSGAWRRPSDGTVVSTQFWTQEARPAAHFTLLLNGIESMVLTGKPAWPVERTLMSSGLLDALLQSGLRSGQTLPTPWLAWDYSTPWRWQEPPPPPPGRPWGEQ